MTKSLFVIKGESYYSFEDAVWGGVFRELDFPFVYNRLRFEGEFRPVFLLDDATSTMTSDATNFEQLLEASNPMKAWAESEPVWGFVTGDLLSESFSGYGGCVGLAVYKSKVCVTGEVRVIREPKYVNKCYECGEWAWVISHNNEPLQPCGHDQTNFFEYDHSEELKEIYTLIGLSVESIESSNDIWV